MRRYLLLLFFVLSVCFTSATQAEQARKLALLIGVDDYQYVSSLDCCVNDMKTLKEALKKIDFEEDNIQMLLSDATKFIDKPTKRNIEKKIAELLRGVQPTDMVFIAFSGHGAQDGKKVYFCPPDMESDDLEGTCISINKIMEDLANCKAKFKWMVVDACRSDLTPGAKGIGGKGLRIISSPPAGIVLFQSCSEGEESWEDSDTGNGFFTKNFAAALSGDADVDQDGKLTLMEVCTWTTAKTKEQVQKSRHVSQQPCLHIKASDFILTESRSILRAKELIQMAHKAMQEEDYALALQKYEEALELHRLDVWERERDYALTLFEKEQAIRDGGPSKLAPTSRVSFRWEGSKIIKFIGLETEVVIPDNVIAIGDYAFYRCRYLESVSVSDSVSEIGASAFEDCKDLKSVTISNSVKTISNRMLSGCSSLAAVKIPDSVTKIEAFAFARCNSLTTIEIPGNVSEIDGSAFSGCSSLKKWGIATDHRYFKSDGMSLLTIDGKKLVACQYAKGDYRIPEGISEIGTGAFNGCTSVKYVVVPKSAAKIGSFAFSESSITSVIIQEGLTEIENGAFQGCKSLTSIVIPKSVTKIGEDAFSDCPKLKIYAPAGSKAEEYAKKAGISFQDNQD